MARMTALFEMRDRMTRHIDRLTRNLNRTQRATRLVSAGAAAMGASFVAAAGLATRAVVDMERNIDRLQATTGITASKAQEFGTVAREVYENAFGNSIAHVTESMSTLHLNLGDMTKDVAKEITETALTIEDLFKAPAAESSKVVKTMIANFEGLSRMDAFDLISTGFLKNMNYAGDFLDTLNEYSVHFSSLGMSADQMLATLIAGSREGAFNLDKVGDSIKETFIRHQELSSTSSEGFAMLGLDANKMADDIAAGGDRANQAFLVTMGSLAGINDEVTRNLAGAALFGTQWDDVGKDVILAAVEGQKGLENFRGATRRVANDAYDNLATKMVMIQRQFGGMFSDLGKPFAERLNKLADKILKKIPEIKEQMQPTLTWLAETGIPAVSDALNGILDKVKAVYNFFKDNWSWIGPFVEGLTISFLAYKGVLMAINAWTKIVTLSQWLWNAAMAANPIGLVVTGIGILIGVGILLYKNWDNIKKKAGELWDKIMDNPLLALAAGPIGVLIAAGISLYKNWDKIKAAVGDLWDGIKKTFKTGVNFVIKHINTMIDGINTLSFKAPDWVPIIGGKGWSPNIPNIPEYAAGGIINRPHVGLVGEAGPEAIIPLSASRRNGALKLWEQVGRMMGVMPHADGGIFGRIKGFFGNNKIQNFAGNAEMAAIGLESSRRGYDKTLNSVYASYEKKMAKVNSIADAYKIRDIGHKTKHLTQGFGNITKMLSRVAIPLALFEGATEIIAAEDKKRAFLKELGATIGGIGAGALAGAMGGALVGAGVFSPLTAMAGAILGAGAGAFGGQALADMLYDRISKFATGTNFAPGGLSLVGEYGPELVDLPRGSRVLSNKETQAILGSVSGRSQVVHKKVNIEQLIGSVTVQNEADEDRLVAKIKRLLERELEEELLAGGGAHAL